MNDCEIVRDLIPLYVENMASESSKKLVDRHIAACPDCGGVMKHAAENKIVVNSAEPLKKMKRGLRRYTAEIAVLASSLTVAAIVNGWVFCVDPDDIMGFAWCAMYIIIPLCGLCCGAVLGLRKGLLKWLFPLFFGAINISAGLCLLGFDIGIFLLSLLPSTAGICLGILIRRVLRRDKAK